MMHLTIKNVVVIQSIINKLKNKMRVIVGTIPFRKFKNNTAELYSNSNNSKNDFNMIIERRSCWCILFIDNGTRVEAKIIHTGSALQSGTCCSYLILFILAMQHQQSTINYVT